VSRLVQQLVNGTVLGATIGLIALGYTMVYGIIQLINFAHGEIFMIGSYAGLAAYTYVLPDSVTRNAWLTLPVVMLAAAVAASLVAVLAERLAYRPLRNAPRLAPLITAIGVSIALQEAVRLFYPGGKNTLSFPGIISRGSFQVGGVTIAWTSVFTVVVAVVSMVALDVFITGTRLGRAMRATSQDPQTAQLMGIDTDKVIVVAFALGGALAGVAGVIQGIRFIQLDFHIGFIAGIKAFTAAVLGGIGNIRGAMLGGILLGLIENLGGACTGLQWQQIIAFSVLGGVLMFRPTGILGEQVGG